MEEVRSRSIGGCWWGVEEGSKGGSGEEEDTVSRKREQIENGRSLTCKVPVGTGPRSSGSCQSTWDEGFSRGEKKGGKC